MAVHSLVDYFRYFFGRLNPSPSYVAVASSELANVKSLLEPRTGPVGWLGIHCFTQGSYRQSTAIHTLNDLDVVALCTSLVQPPRPAPPTAFVAPSPGVSRDELFAAVAGALAQDHRYRGKIAYSTRSICVKVDLGVKVEVLPAVMHQSAADGRSEPFRMYHPDRGGWVDGYARHHQTLLSMKNGAAGDFYIPMVKVLKHLRDVTPGFDRADAVSFHLECLLYRVPEHLFFGTAADAIAAVLGYLTGVTPAFAPTSGWTTPMADRFLFGDPEWGYGAYERFHGALRVWAYMAGRAAAEPDQAQAIAWWKALLGDEYFRRAER